jgi:hypothetical protein
MTTTRRLAAILAVGAARCSPALLLPIVLFHCPSNIAFAQAATATTIHLVWTEVVDRTTPDPHVGIKTRKTMTVSLQADGKISQESESRSGQFNSHATSTTKLGGDWRVEAGNVLQRLDDYPNHVRVMRVTVDGRNFCSLSVTHELKAGRTTYSYPMISRPGQHGTYSRIATQSTSCSIN